MTRHINLIDPPKKARSPFTTVLQMGVPIALVLLVMGAWGAVVRYQVSATKQKLNEIEAQMRPVGDQLAQLQTGMGIDQLNVTLRERLQRAEAQLKARRNIQTALQRGDLGTTHGFSEFMRAFARQTVAGLWLTGLKLENGGRDVTLKGRALSAEAVARLVHQLRAEPALHGRSIATLRVAPMPPAEKVADEAFAAMPAPPSVAQPQIYEFEISSLGLEAEAKTEAPAGISGTMGGAIQKMAEKVLQ